MASIKFNCPNCGLEMVVEEDYAGRNAKCPECNQKFVIPIIFTPVEASQTKNSDHLKERAHDSPATIDTDSLANSLKPDSKSAKISALEKSPVLKKWVFPLFGFLILGVIIVVIVFAINALVPDKQLNDSGESFGENQQETITIRKDSPVNMKSTRHEIQPENLKVVKDVKFTSLGKNENNSSELHVTPHSKIQHPADTSLNNETVKSENPVKTEPLSSVSTERQVPKHAKPSKNRKSIELKNKLRELKKLAKENCEKKFPLEKVAELNNIKWPIPETILSLADVDRLAEAEAEKVIENQFPHFDRNKIISKAQKKYPLWKKGDTVSFFDKRGRRIDGEIYACSSAYMHVGRFKVMAIDFTDSMKIHILKGMNDKLIQKYVEKSLLNYRKARKLHKLSAFNKRKVAILVQNGYIQHNRKWYNDKEIMSLLNKSRDMLISEAIPSEEKKIIAPTRLYAYHNGRWMLPDEADRLIRAEHEIKTAMQEAEKVRNYELSKNPLERVIKKYPDVDKTKEAKALLAKIRSEYGRKKITEAMNKAKSDPDTGRLLLDIAIKEYPNAANIDEAKSLSKSLFSKVRKQRQLKSATCLANMVMIALKKTAFTTYKLKNYNLTNRWFIRKISKNLKVFSCDYASLQKDDKPIYEATAVSDRILCFTYYVRYMNVNKVEISSSCNVYIGLSKETTVASLLAVECPGFGLLNGQLLDYRSSVGAEDAEKNFKRILDKL